MWKPQKFKMIYLVATLYVLTLTLPSASAVYWAFGDMLLNHSNAFALLPRNGFRDTAVILMLIHQVRSVLEQVRKSSSSCNDSSENSNRATRCSWFIVDIIALLQVCNLHISECPSQLSVC